MKIWLLILLAAVFSSSCNDAGVKEKGVEPAAEQKQENAEVVKVNAILNVNNVNIAYDQCGSGDTTLLFIHGWCINKEYWSEQKNYFCDKLFLAVDGFNTTHGLSTPNVEEAHLNRVMIEISKQVIVGADSSKFHKRSFAFISPITDVDVLVTDSEIPAEDRKKLENAGVKLIIV